MSLDKKTIAIFDFDGTLTLGDTLLPFLLHIFGIGKVFLGLIITSPYLLCYFLGLISNEKAKKHFIYFFLKDTSVKNIERCAKTFIDNKLNVKIRKNLINRLRWHQEKKHITVLVSASLDVYVLAWAKKFKFDYVECTKLYRNNGKFTGDFFGSNCYGFEKVIRLKNLFGESFSDYKKYGYGDSSGDLEFLNLCDHRYFKKDLNTL